MALLSPTRTGSSVVERKIANLKATSSNLVQSFFAFSLFFFFLPLYFLIYSGVP